ncbi:hypothetical protein AB0F59_12430 [Micromonospora lupini]|uniref:hypothetical protein n=1 Tax=Micromonospora lupini TaxID=285679 RepID=UPI0033F92974
MKSLSRRGVRILAAAGLAVPATLAFAGPAHAETNPRCADSVQIGATAYVTVGGQTAASVTQYKGCGRNYAYTYVWQRYRASHGSYQRSGGHPSGRCAASTVAWPVPATPPPPGVGTTQVCRVGR